MQTLETLKRKINSAEDLSSVVGTMKTLAAVSIRQYELAVESLAEYFTTIEDGLRILLWDSPTSPINANPEEHRAVGAIVFGSDQGMCGQFNEQIANSAIDHMLSESATEDAPWSFLAVGTRAAGRLADNGYEVDSEIPVPGSSSGITPLVQDLLATIEEWRTQKRLGRILLFYNRRLSASSYRPHLHELLPINPQQFQGLQRRRWPSRTLPMFTIDRELLLSRLVRHYLFVCLFRASAESLAGENASRIASMQAAERNIQDRLAELRSGYNQQRQTAITEELLDVVTGFEALRDEP